MVHADKLDELNRTREQLQQETNEVNNQINDKESSINQLETEKADLQKTVGELQKNLDELISKLQEQEAKLQEINANIEALQVRVAQLETVIVQRTEKLNSQARFIQTKASMGDLVTIVASSESLSDMVGKVTAVTKLVTTNNDTLTQQEQDKAEVEQSKALVEEEKAAAEEMKQQITISKNNVAAQKTELDHEIARIIENVELTQEEKSALESAQANLHSQTEAITQDIQTEEARIAAEKAEQERIAAEKAEQERIAAEKAEQERIAAEVAAQERIAAEKAEQERIAAEKSAAEAKTSNLYAGNSQAAAPAAPAAKSSTFIRPASGFLSSPFGYRINPVDGVYRMHNGIDIAGSGPIVAIQSGTVTFAGYNSVYGYYVIVDHGMINGKAMKSLYSHLTPGMQVAPGQSVSQGQRLGTMGTTGMSTGVHLHFEIHENGTPVNPLNYISL